MTKTQRILGVLVLLGGWALCACRGDEEPGSDLVPLMPAGQGRLFDNRYYGGPGQGNSLVLSPDGKYAVGNGGGSQLMVYEMGKTANRQGRLLLTDNANFYQPAIAFTPDGKSVIAMANNFPDQNLHFFDLASGKQTRQIDNDQQFGSVAISPDGKLLALGTNQKIEIWDAATSDDVLLLNGPQNVFFHVLAFSGDGRMLAAASNNGIQVWELATGRERAKVRLTNEQPTGNVNLGFRFKGGFGPMGMPMSSLAFSADGSILAAATNDNAIRLWNLRTGQELPPLVGHQGQVSSLVFTPDGKRLLSLDSGGLKLDWDARRLSKAGPAKLRSPSDSELAELWDSLTDADAFATYRTERLLAVDPQRTLAFLQKHLQPVPTGNSEKISRLIADLQSQSGSVRRKAMAGIRQEGEAALGALIQGAGNNPGFNQTIPMMINKLEIIYNTRERQRAVKAVGVLEQIGNTEAKAFLEKLAKGASGTRLTEAAKAALQRIKTGQVRDQAPVETKVLWDDLAGADAMKAFSAVIHLSSQPGQTMPWLREHMKPVKVPDPKRLDELVASLDDSNFATRKQAMADLEKLGEAAIPALNNVLASKPSLEIQQRAKQLLAKLDKLILSSYQLQQVRAVEVLEQIGSPEARKLLKELSVGPPSVRLTRDARGSLERLEKRVAAAK